MAFFIGGVVAPAAFAATAFANWKYIGHSGVSCGYGRASIDNTAKDGETRVYNVTDSGGCNVGNASHAVGEGRLAASLSLVDATTGYGCGNTPGYIYSTTTTADWRWHVAALSSTNCRKSSGDAWYSYSVHLKYDPATTLYMAAQTQSPNLNFN
ncbi:hypothetical protein [Marmoricola sp. OAE513]|uniref:hypothetical protein n=1 Tax=Marmoricola sp. OAE513 TaxID=2817894 RepID=UPI001AE4C2C3